MDTLTFRENEWTKYLKSTNLKDLKFQVSALNKTIKYLNESKLTLDGFIQALYTDYLTAKRSTDVYGQGNNRMVKAKQKISLIMKADPELQIHRNNKYIDIGSGDGTMALTLIQQYKLNNYLFTDVEDHLSPEVKQFIIDDGEEIKNRFSVMDPKGKSAYQANIVSIFQVLHHSGDIDHVLKRLNIPVGGKLLLSEHDVSTPNLRYLVLLEHISYEIFEIHSGYTKEEFRKWFLNYDLDLTSFDVLNKKLHMLNYVLVGKTPPSRKNATYYSVYLKVDQNILSNSSNRERDTSREQGKERGRGNRGRARNKGRESQGVNVKKEDEVEKVTDPLVFDSLDLLFNNVLSNIVSHVFGFTASNVTKDLVTLFLNVRSRKKDLIHFVCYKTTEKALEAYKLRAKSGKGEDAIYDPLIGVFAGEYEKIDYKINKMIFCTTRKMIGLLLKFKETNILHHISSIFINSWDEYDVNAYALLGLLTQVLKKHLLKCHVILTSVSRWIFPSIELELQAVSINFNKIDIEYPTDHTPLEMVIEISKEKNSGATITYLGDLKYDKGDVNENIVFLGTHPIKSKEATFVIDSMRNQYGGKITKQLADLRADSISKGFVNRYISYEGYLNLKEMTLPKEKSGLNNLIIFFLSKGFEQNVIKGLFMQSHRMQVEKFLKEFSSYNLSSMELKLMKVTGLGINSTVFLHNWITPKIVKGMKQKNRSMYVGILIACLINRKPQIYTVDGDTKVFQKFRGRNDIETMCNMWLDLQTSLPVPFVFWKDVEYRTSDWSNLDKDNKFDQDAILELFNLIKTTVIYMLKDKRELPKEFERRDKGSRSKRESVRQTIKSNRPDYGYGVFKRILEVEINDAVDVIKHLFPPTDIKWDFSDILPFSPTKEGKKVVYPIQSKENMLYMYVIDTKLYALNMNPENLDAFMLLD